jgi:hypothetical protein
MFGSLIPPFFSPQKRTGCPWSDFKPHEYKWKGPSCALPDIGSAIGKRRMIQYEARRAVQPLSTSTCNLCVPYA